jgi:hypothetical protein
MALVIRLKKGVTLSSLTNITWATLNDMFDKGYAQVESGSIENADVADGTLALAKLVDLTAGFIIVGDGGNRPVGVLMHGDATVAADGTVTVANHLKNATQWHADPVTFPAKTTPVGADLILIEDSAAAWGKKQVTLTNAFNAFGVYPRFAKHNLVVKPNALVPDTQVDVTADELVVSDDATQTVHKLRTAVSVTINPASGGTGANQLDTGSFVTATRYYVHVIYNATTNTVAGLMSLSPTAPAMPAGYGYRRCVGEVYSYTSGSVKLYQQYRDGDWVWLKEPQQVYNGITATRTATALPLVIPTGAVELDFEVGIGNGTYPGAHNINVVLSPEATAGYDLCILATAASGTPGAPQSPTGLWWSHRARMRHNGAASIYVMSATNPAVGYQRGFVWGYRLPR